MKNKIISAVASAMIKVGNAYDGNVSPEGFYKPAKANKKSK